MTNRHAVDREEVMAFLDGELGGSRATEVEAHISGCKECREMVDSFRQVSGNLNAWAVEPAPLDLAPRLRGTIATRAVPGRTWFGLPRWAAVVAPAAVGLAFVAAWPVVQRFAAVDTVTVNTDPVFMNSVPPPSATHTEDMPFVPSTTGSAGAFSPPSAPQQGQRGQPPFVALQSLEPASGPMIARSVALSIVTDHFSDVRAALERVTAEVRGTVSSLTMTGDPPAQRSLHATVRVPADRLDAALLEVRKLGNVRKESQSSEDVADAHRDLVVRIDNSIKEEARLNELLVNRTGRLQDVLAVEQEVTRVRGQIEQMKAQEIAMRNRVTYATISVEISEAYKAEVTLGAGPQPIGARLRNAIVEGWSAAASTAFGLVLFALEAGPSVLLWSLVIGPPVWWFWRRARRTVS